MKKTFLAKRNALLSSESAYWSALVLAFAIAVLIIRLLLPNVFWYILSPIFNASNALADKSHALIASFGDVAALSVQNEELMKENAAFSSENQALVKKMESVSALLSGRSAELRSATGILAAVVSRPLESPYDTLLIASGSADGVLIGMEAFGIGGMPIGIVSSVMDHHSRVTLFSAPRMFIGGWVGQANLPIIIHGGGAGTLNASVARSANITVADTVYVPGPGMLPIGKVVRIDSDFPSPSITLRIQPLVNVFSLGWITLRYVGNIQFTATSTFP